MRFFFFFLFYLILLLCIFLEYSLAIDDTNFIQCTTCPQITVSFTQSLLFPSQCQENNVYSLACGIEYRINYDTKEITIDFQATNNTGSLEDKKPSEFLVQTLWLSLGQNITEPNIITRKYGCNTNNDCAKQHYINTINYFITEGILQLDLIKTKLHNDSLIVGKESKRSCINNEKNVTEPSRRRCSTGLCYALVEHFNLNNQQFQKIQKCEVENRPFLFSEIEHHTPTSLQKERKLLKYQCNKNVCNRDGLIEKIETLIGEYTNGPSRLQGDKSISGKSGGLILQQTISSSSILVSSIILLIQLFI